MQIVMAVVAGAEGDMACAALIGGFLFGVAGALGLRFLEIEKDPNSAIEAKVSWSADPCIVQAGELVKTQPDVTIQ